MAKITAENLADVIRAKAGELPEDRVRHIEVEALVDTGATLLCLPKSKIDELGLLLLDKR